MAPEAVCFGKHSTASDVWSFAILLSELFTFGKRPFDELSDLEV
jgi:serine/threonine protein kinase